MAETMCKISLSQLAEIKLALETIDSPYIKLNGDFAENTAVLKDFDKALRFVNAAMRNKI